MRILTSLMLFLVLTAQVVAADKPIPVGQAAAAMKVPAGFKVQLVAGEPTIVQPIAFTFDDRGRLWVVECLSYPKWSRDGRGNDRVCILEDPDANGTFRKKTVVIDNGVNLSGLELGFGGLYLCSTPNLLFLPLKDDKPAGPPVVLLDGWNLNEAKHNVFNSLIWGPDGWLYGCNGIQTRSWVGKPGTPKEARTYLDCGVWRFHPVRHEFEVVATGTTNPWGLDWDDRGEMFITNCVIDHLWHLHPGGRYQRMYGQDPNPYAFWLMGPSSDHKHWGGGAWTDSRADRVTGALKKEHDDAGGGHAHSGCAIYLGTNFPPEYRNAVFMANIHGNRLNQNRLSYESHCTIVGKRAPDFLFANDPWFRGLCVKVGPEGALYVSDWCDTGECHNYDVADTSNGRIYRTYYERIEPFQGNVAAFSVDELAKAHLSANEWLVRQARRVLHERAASGQLDAAQAGRQLRTLLAQQPQPKQRLRLMWTLEVLGQLTTEDVQELIRHPETAAWAVRLARDPEQIRTLVSQAPVEERFRVYAAAASRMMKLPPTEAFRLARDLFQAEALLADFNLTQLCWLGIQPAVSAQPEEALRFISAIRWNTIQRHTARLLASGSKPRLDDLLGVVANATTSATQEAVMQGMLDALEGQRQVPAPRLWAELLPKLLASASPTLRESTESLALVFGDSRVIETLKQRMLNPKADAILRQRAVTRLAQQKLPELPRLLRPLLTDPAIRGAALRALAQFNDPEIPTVILEHYAEFSTADKSDAMQTLASRPGYALSLLGAVEQGRVPKADLSAFTARQLHALQDKAVSAKLEQVWGTVRPASAMRTQQTQVWKAYLTEATLKQADVKAGQTVFAQHCGTCHKMHGVGGEVGPELTGSQRKNLDYVLENVLDPSAVVPSEWRMSIFNLVDGRTLTGIIRRETPQALVIRTLNEEVTVPVADVESRKPTALSIMPEGLFDKLSREQVRDLIAYLAGP